MSTASNQRKQTLIQSIVDWMITHVDGITYEDSQSFAERCYNNKLTTLERIADEIEDNSGILSEADLSKHDCRALISALINQNLISSTCEASKLLSKAHKTSAKQSASDKPHYSLPIATAFPATLPVATIISNNEVSRQTTSSILSSSQSFDIPPSSRSLEGVSRSLTANSGMLGIMSDLSDIS